MSKRVLLVIVFVAFAALGALGRLVVLRLEDSGVAGDDMPPPAAAGAAASGDVPPAGAAEMAAGGEAAFAHFAPDAVYPLDAWSLEEALAGAIDHVSIAGPRPGALDSRRLSAADTLLMAGWAGEPVLGMPLSHVLFSFCGQVFGATAVVEPRPAIRRFVHPNLAGSGWSARLAVAALPRCSADEAPILRAWGARDDRILYPLEGVTLLAPPEGRAVTSAIPPGRAVLRPDDLPPLERRRLEVTQDGAAVRACPRIDCTQTGRLAAGPVDAVLLDHAGRWTLLVAGDVAGWLADGHFEMLGGPDREDAS